MAEPNSERVVCIALGSNVGDRASHLERALRALRATAGVRVLETSRWHETEPVGPGAQGRYLNGAARLATTLDARALLARLLEIERGEGRVREPGVRWAPRALDLDLLLDDQSVRDEPGLTIPHPRMHERSFVLEPLREVAGAARVPTLGRTVAELAARARDRAMGPADA